MSPATHAVMGAVVAGAAPRIWLAIPLAFVSHFICDAIYHFEAFYPLSRTLGTTHNEATAVTAVVVGLLLSPVLWILGRRSGRLAAFYLYVVGSSAVFALGDWRQRTAVVLLVIGILLLLGNGPRLGAWIAGALAAQLPDLIRAGIEPLNRFHIFMHYEGTMDLGEILYRFFEKKSNLNFDLRFENAYYLTGYVLELLLESGIVIAALYYLSRANTVGSERSVKTRS